MKTNKSQYSALKLMKELSNENIFLSKNFINEMKIRGYVSPFKYIWAYKKRGLIKKLERGKYKIISQPS
jgi:hypothetical protein